MSLGVLFLVSRSQQCGKEIATLKSLFHFVLEATCLFRERKTRGCGSCPRVLPESPSSAATDEPLPCAGSPRWPAPNSHPARGNRSFSRNCELPYPHCPGEEILFIQAVRDLKQRVFEAGIYEKKRKIAPAAGGSRGLQRAPSSAALPCEGTRPNLPLPTLISLFD